MIADAVSGSDHTTKRILLAIFIGALAVRLIALVQGLEDPSFRFPVVDAGAYDLIARALAAGGEIPQRLFWQPLLYPVFLATVYALSGSSILAAKVVQAAIGALTCCLVFILGRRQIDQKTGIAAASITALCGPLILFEGELLAAGLAAFWAILLVLVLTAVADRPKPLPLLMLGIVAAASFATRPTFGLFLVAATIWLGLTVARRLGTRSAIVSLTLLFLGAAVLLAPIGLLSRQHTGRFSVVPASGGLNAFIGNNPATCESLSIRPGDEWGELVNRPARLGHHGLHASNAYFRSEVIGYARAQPASFVAGLAQKALRMVSSRELPRNIDPYLASEWSPVTRALTWKAGAFGFPFGILLPLAVWGVVRAWRRMGTPVLLFLAFYPAAVIAIFVASRYRVPMLPLVAFAAAVGARDLVDVVRGRHTRTIALASVVLVGSLLLATLPGPFCEEQLDARADFLSCLAHAQVERGEVDLAIESYREVLAENSELPQVHYNLGLLYESREQYDDAMAHFTDTVRLDPGHARALNNLGSIAESTGDLASAERRFAQAVALQPDLAVAHRNLGNIRLQLGRPAEAIPSLEQALELESDQPDALFLLGSSRLQTGDLPGAIDALDEATRLAQDPRFHNELGTALIGARRLDEAVDQFQAAIALAPDYIDPYNNAGAALAMKGDLEGAVDFFRRAVERRPDYIDAHFNLSTLLLRTGRIDEAKKALTAVLSLNPEHAAARKRLEDLAGSQNRN